MEDEERISQKYRLDSGLRPTVLPFPFDIDRALDDGGFLNAGKQKGKTNTAKWITEYLMSLGYTVKVFDISSAWRKPDSPIPFFVKVDMFNDIDHIINPLSLSIVYDIQSIYPEDTPDFCAKIISRDFELISRLPIGTHNGAIFYIFEECQFCLPNGSLRAKRYQEIYRIVCVGSNYTPRMIPFGITQRPADVSTKLISRVGQKYFGNAWEENDIKKLKKFMNIRKYTEAHDMLSVLGKGEFYYCVDSNRKLIKVPLFKRGAKQQIDLSRESIGLYRTKPKLSFWDKFFGKKPK